jgi:hypothetical protein
MRNECDFEIFEIFTSFVFDIDGFLLVTLSSRVIDFRRFEIMYCLSLKSQGNP